MLISVLVCNQVDRILQNKLDGKPGERMLGGRKTVIFEFLGTGMISVMPVPRNMNFTVL